MTYRLQNPADIEKWARDWTTEYLASGETVSAYQWEISPDSSPTLLSNATAETVSVGSLTPGVVYRLSLTVTTTNGRTAKRAITLRGEEF